MAVFDHDYDPLESLGFQGRPKRQIFYGVELEVEFPKMKGATNSFISKWRDYREQWRKSVQKLFPPRFTVIKHDGSLKGLWGTGGHFGFEIVTAPASLMIHQHRWSKFFVAMPKELEVSDRCGMHVHISREPLTKDWIGKMLVFLNATENREFVTTVAGRTPGEYCKVMVKSMQDVGEPYEEGPHLFDHERNQKRYEALNLTKRRTVELRIFASTLDSTRFLANLEFTAALVGWAEHAREGKLTPDYLRDWVDKQVGLRHLKEFFNDLDTK